MSAAPVIEIERAPVQSARDRVLDALHRRELDRERNQYLPTAWTLPALAQATGVPLRTVTREIERMFNAGEVSSRRHRSGATLYKLFDPRESRGMLTIA